MIYLDNAATTFHKPPAVARAVQWAMNHCATPGRGGYPLAMEAAEAVYACREEAAALFDCEPEQVVFTMNATHGLNLAIMTLVPEGGRVVISGFAHNAVVRPLHACKADIHVAGTQLFCPGETLSQMERVVTPDTAAVVCTHVSNVFGDIAPLEQIAQLCRQRGVPLIVDAAQSAGILPLSLRKTGAAFIAMPGHKSLYGPQGTGILLCSQPPKPLLHGGTGSSSRLPTMPDWLPDCAEAGTANVPGICGLREGLRFVSGQMETIAARERRLARQMAEGLKKLEGVRVFCGENQAGVLSFQLPMPCEDAAEALAQEGIAVRAGLHCAPMAHQWAGTLETGTVRASFSAFNTARQIDQTLDALQRITNRKKL